MQKNRSSSNRPAGNGNNAGIEEKSIVIQSNVSNEKDQLLLEKLLKYEAELQKEKEQRKKAEKEKKNLEKKHSTVVQSNEWKLILPVRKAVSFLKRAVNFLRRQVLGSKYVDLTKRVDEQSAQNITLQREIKYLKEKLQTTEVKLREQEKQGADLRLRLQQLDKEKLAELVKSAKEHGETLEVLDLILNNKLYLNEKYSEALRYAAKLYINTDEDIKYFVYRRVMKGLSMEEIPEFLVREAVENKLSLEQTSSFRANLTRRLRLAQIKENLPEWILDNKVSAYSFIDNLGVRRPWVKEAVYKFIDIPEQEGIVIKPRDGAGSRGVYLITSFSNIQDVKRGQILNNWEELETYIQEDLELGWVKEDEWIIEELIYEDRIEKLPARDLKFYCFYGEVALILEVSRYPHLKYCWWSPDGKPIRTGKYENELFEGRGITQENVELAASVSREIPVPFIRIDFLHSEDGLVFGEFTPKPGNYDQFDESTDKLLGELYLEAEINIFYDMLASKSFDYYRGLQKD